ncbi:helix-turn-helix domain-containing protein [Clostridium felsineum]|uniref:helix-turn-helix domain-containing protein n=1 Tax=Clostridium felsineum TaxID=36839 RepID=UPI00098C1285|nr:helix-turn-helix transcriptional regulator [Clostridium felsineum]URZ18325.1 hypothetical protein CLFE_043950 [Clostridium felsineum DSM 794]
MRDLNIGIKISSKRKEKRITQEELADFLGVTKPAISKWESGQTYPDITLLPLIASYFNTTIDELIGYEPQLSKNDIRLLYSRLAENFSSKPFEEIYDKCIEYQKRYYSCFELQLNIALILINHSSLGQNTSAIISKASNILQHVIDDSDNITIEGKAIFLQSYCFLILKKPDSVIKNLNYTENLHLNPEILLSSAYQMKGDNKKAISILQNYIYECIIGIVNACPNLMMLYSTEREKAYKWADAIIKIEDVLNISKINPSPNLSLLITAANISMMNNDTDKAIDFLEKYVDTALNPNMFPIKLKSNDFFDSLDDLFNSLDLGTTPPRNDKVIKEDIKKLLIEPIFEPLKSNENYIRLVKRINRI